MIIETPSKDRICGRMREYMEKQDNQNKTPDTGNRITSKQIVALGGVVLLVLMYIATLVVAVVDNSDSGKWFMSCIFATVAVPLLIWIYTWMYGKLTGRHTIADAPQGLDADTAKPSDTVSPVKPNNSSENK